MHGENKGPCVFDEKVYVVQKMEAADFITNCTETTPYKYSIISNSHSSIINHSNSDNHSYSENHRDNGNHR